MVMTQSPTVILGSGLAGWTLARELRALSPSHPITLITTNAGDFYSKPMLSNAFALKRSVSALLQTTGQQQAEKIGVDLRAHMTVTAIDIENKTVCCDRAQFAYGDLVLAVGANPIRLPLAGATHVLSVNDWWDYAVLRDRLDQVAPSRDPRVLILGAGLIGCEFANDLSVGGYRVDVVDPGERALERLITPTDSAQLEAALADLGVTFHFKTVANTVVETADKRLAVTLANGQTHVADVVLSAVGLRPRTDLAAAAGLGVDRGVSVNSMGQASAPNVWALGDCAAYPGLSATEGAVGTPRVMPFVLPIMTAAKAMARSILGEPTAIVFPPMAVRVKTPAFPLTIHA